MARLVVNHTWIFPIGGSIGRLARVARFPLLVARRVLRKLRHTTTLTSCMYYNRLPSQTWYCKPGQRLHRHSAGDSSYRLHPRMACHV